MNPSRSVVTVAAAMLAFALAAPVRADRDLRSGAPPAGYLQACGECHVAYPAGLLPTESWSRLLAGLERHFGSDASLDATTLEAIERYLVAGAGAARRGATAPPDDRITRSSWFTREHRRIDATTWALPSVMRASNCAACHPDAARGRYDEHRLIVPAGASAAQARAFRD